MLTRGGNIYAARLPGDAFPVPGTVDQIIELVSTQTHDVLKTNRLENGMKYSYAPEKAQDWMFQQHVEQDPYSGNPLNLPFLMVAIQQSGGEAGALLSLTFQGAITLEYLTTDVSNTFFKSPVDPELFALLVRELSQVNLLTENPNHLAHTAEVIKRVLKSDSFKKYARMAIGAGVKVVPLVASAALALL